MDANQRQNNDNQIVSDTQEDNLDESYHGIYGDSIKIKKGELVSLLKCQICCGIYRTPTTINECLDTFCRSCIYKYFNEKGIHVRDTCPICGIKLGGRPMESLRYNPSLGLLVDILFPEFEEIDKENTVCLFYLLLFRIKCMKLSEAIMKNYLGMKSKI